MQTEVMTEVQSVVPSIRAHDLDQLPIERLCLEDEIRGEMTFEGIVGKSAVWRWLLNQVETVAPTESTVLIYGETGTGKELVARALHSQSPRRPNAFVKVNCAAIPAGLLESELFGQDSALSRATLLSRRARLTYGACSKKPNDSGFWRSWMKPVGSLQVQGAPLLTWD